MAHILMQRRVLLKQLLQEEEFLLKVVIQDKSCFYVNTTMSVLMAHQDFTTKKKVAGHKTLAEGYAYCFFFFDNNGVVYCNFVSVGQMMKYTIYTEVLKCLRDIFQRKMPGKW
jgi:hypothetical protein